MEKTSGKDWRTTATWVEFKGPPVCTVQKSNAILRRRKQLVGLTKMGKSKI
jgi:hypothetical protein